MDTNTEARWVFRRAEIVTRCIEIARERLEGDPLREVQALERRAGELFEQYDGGDVGRVTVIRLPAYAVGALLHPRKLIRCCYRWRLLMRLRPLKVPANGRNTRDGSHRSVDLAAIRHHILNVVARLTS